MLQNSHYKEKNGDCLKTSISPVSLGLSWYAAILQWTWENGVAPHDHHGQQLLTKLMGTVHHLWVYGCYE